MFTRAITPRIELALSDTPVVLVMGPPQSGKTTLVGQLAGSGMQYITLDDGVTRQSVQRDPAGFIKNLGRAIIEDVQRASEHLPALLLAIKKTVDEDRRPGRFLLTGSADLMTLPRVAGSLVGRMEVNRLLPLSQGEIESSGCSGAGSSGAGNWIDSIFAGTIPSVTHLSLGLDLMSRVLKGGYPEAVSRAREDRRIQWAQTYLDAIIARDVVEIAQVDKLNQMPSLFKALAHTAGQMSNYAKLGGQVGLDSKTTNRYVGILEQLYLIARVPVWAANHLNRVVKTPKLQFIDSGLLAATSGFTAQEAHRDATRATG